MSVDDYRANLKTIETPHGKFAYAEVGEGPPAVFVHGLFMSGYMWHGVVDELKSDRRCIAYNLPHHGGSAHWLRETIPGFVELTEVDGGKLFWPFERPDELVPHVRRLWAATAPAGAR